jgi:hypothetical protein
MAAKFFVGLALDDPDPECVKGHADGLVAAAAARGGLPVSSSDHSRPAVVTLGRKPIAVR